MKRAVPLMAAIGLVLGLGGGRASAATIMFDNTGSQLGGTIFFGSTAGSVVTVTGALINLVTNGTTSLAVTSTCGPTHTFGCIGFTTGTFVSQVNNGGSSYTNTYSGGGNLSITGTAGPASGTLFSSLGFAGPVTLTYNTITRLVDLTGSLLGGTLNATLAAALGVLPGVGSGTATNASIHLTLNPKGADPVRDTVTFSATPIPEPGSMLLLSTGLFGLARAIRRRRR